ncbi:hypothetical protein ABZ615_18230 [Streptomyces sp. NPDC007325]|uniref:hypothetical protein n=1 Tax=Streptomyces sp. NPDC007325 TaxID=3154588 RepID=UPI00340FAB75
MVILKEAQEQGYSALTAVHKVKSEGLFEAGKEFNVAFDLKAVYGLTVFQLHDIVGWLRGMVSDEDLNRSLSS